MAIVNKLEQNILQRISKQTKVDATYSIINEDEGVSLQIDTYGSESREFKGKKSQSIRFSPKAILELKRILNRL